MINLKLKGKDTIDLVVQTVLSKLQGILEKGEAPSLSSPKELTFI